MENRIRKTRSYYAKRLTRAWKKRDEAMNAVYASQVRGDIPFNACLEKAPAKLVADYREACEVLRCIEMQAAIDHRGYYDGGSRFHLYETARR